MFWLGESISAKRNAKMIAWIGIKLPNQIDLNQQAEIFNKCKFYFEMHFLKAGPVKAG